MSSVIPVTMDMPDHRGSWNPAVLPRYLPTAGSAIRKGSLP